jgi:hypothetical protein
MAAGLDAHEGGAEMMIRAWRRAFAALFFAGCHVLGAWAADVRAKADVTCKPTEKQFTYDCTIKLSNSRTGEALTDVTLTVGADMPSMPLAHNVRPARAEAGQEPGTFTARIELEMFGDWALRLDVGGKVRDRVIATMRFEADRAVPAAASKPPPRHRH